MTANTRNAATAMTRTAAMSGSTSMGMNCAYTAMQSAMNIARILGAIFMASIIISVLISLVILQVPDVFYTPFCWMTA